MVVFFDIEAAFDKVWHAGLIKKLVDIKLPYYLLRIIINFLSNRKFVVKVNDAKSEPIAIACGVPQGAVLSPTLFSIYINDSPSRNSKNLEQTLLFADDTAYSIMFKRMDQTTKKRINRFISELEQWSIKWRVTLAPQKCNFMLFTKKNND